MANKIETMRSDSVDTIITQWRNENSEADLLPMAILGRLAKLGKYIDNDILHCHDQYNLRQGEFDVLATLRRSGKPYSLTPSELYQSMMLTSGAKKIDTVLPAHINTQHDLLAGMNQQDRESLSELLKRWLMQLETAK